MALLPVHRLFLLSARLRLTDAEQAEIKSLLTQINDWDEMVRWAIARQAGPFLFKKLSVHAELIPQTALQALKQSWLKTLSRSMVLGQHFKEVATTFSLAGIDLIAMKGIYLSEHLYREPGLRQFSDIDLLVREADGDRAIALLSEMGYGSETLYMSGFYELHKDKRRPVHYPPMLKNGVSIEIHCRLYEDDSPYKVDMDALWENAVDVTLYGVGVKVFSPEHLLINLCLHLDKHFQGGEFQFTGFYDIANLLDGCGVAVDYQLMERIAREWNVVPYVYRHFALCEKYFGVNLDVMQISSLYKLTKTDILLFSERLVGEGSKVNFFARHGRELSRFETPLSKLLFVWHYFFPSREFIRRRYQPRNQLHLLLFYPYRFYIAFKISFSALKGKLHFRNNH